MDHIRSNRFDKEYELFSPELKANWDSKEDFVRTENENLLLPHLSRRNLTFIIDRFILSFSESKEGQTVILSGCLTMEENGVRYKYWGSAEVKRIGSTKWSISGVPTVNPGLSAGGPKRCGD
jgi:hypothetical protein